MADPSKKNKITTELDRLDDQQLDALLKKIDDITKLGKMEKLAKRIRNHGVKFTAGALLLGVLLAYPTSCQIHGGPNEEQQLIIDDFEEAKEVLQEGLKQEIANAHKDADEKIANFRSQANKLIANAQTAQAEARATQAEAEAVIREAERPIRKWYNAARVRLVDGKPEFSAPSEYLEHTPTPELQYVAHGASSARLSEEFSEAWLSDSDEKWGDDNARVVYIKTEDLGKIPSLRRIGETANHDAESYTDHLAIAYIVSIGDKGEIIVTRDISVDGKKTQIEGSEDTIEGDMETAFTLTP